MWLIGSRCWAKPGAAAPTATPAAMPMKIQAVSEGRFIFLPT